MINELNKRISEMRQGLKALPVPAECNISAEDFDEMTQQGVNYRLDQLEAKWAQHEAKIEAMATWDDSKLADRWAKSIIKRNNDAKIHKELVDWTKSLIAETMLDRSLPNGWERDWK